MQDHSEELGKAFPVTFFKTSAAFCLCPKNLKEAVFETSGLICLLEEILGCVQLWCVYRSVHFLRFMLRESRKSKCTASAVGWGRESEARWSCWQKCGVWEGTLMQFKLRTEWVPTKRSQLLKRLVALKLRLKLNTGIRRKVPHSLKANSSERREAEVRMTLRGPLLTTTIVCGGGCGGEGGCFTISATKERQKLYRLGQRV